MLGARPNRSIRRRSLDQAPAREELHHSEILLSVFVTAQRLLFERQDATAVEPLRRLLQESRSAVGRAHALWTLHGLKVLGVTPGG